MALAAEQVFYAAVETAEGVRQATKVAALATYGYDPTKAVAYVTAISDADVAYQTAVIAAQNTSNLLMGNVGFDGPLPFANWATIVK